jgi:hypothetical protein
MNISYDSIHHYREHPYVKDFMTDESFAEGSGKSYTAGTNVYYTANGEWDCFGGTSSPVATVEEIKDYLGINEEIEIA